MEWCQVIDKDETNGMNELTGAILAAAFKVHSALGPGLLESAYHDCLAHELKKAGFAVRQQVSLPIKYDGLALETCYRMDMVVEDKVVLELKALEKVLPLHHAQLLTYIKLSNKPVGLLLNFNVVRLVEGVKRMINTR